MEGVFGLFANTFSTFAVHPIDVIKTNYQLGRTTQPLTVRKIVQNVWQTRGVRGLYSGLTPNLATYPIFWAVYFGTSQVSNDYEIVSNKHINKFVKSYGAGLIASGLTNPLFVLKTRMQNINRKTSLIETIRQTNKSGSRAYMKGLGSTYINNLKLGIQFPLYDVIKTRTDSVFIASTSLTLISSSILYPLDLIRVIQRNSDVKLRLCDVGRKVYMREGVRGLYKGALLYNCVSTPNFVIMMIGLEFLRSNMSGFTSGDCE